MISANLWTFYFSGLKLKLSCVSACVLGWSRFRQSGKVVALQGLEGVGKKRGDYSFYNKYKEGFFFFFFFSLDG